VKNYDITQINMLLYLINCSLEDRDRVSIELYYELVFALLVGTISNDLERPLALMLISHGTERRAVSLRQLSFLFDVTTIATYCNKH